ncbi:MAG: hypothetical protein H6Q73_800 [Firmicutes bacterium]|nr:hypothetical protein [Bacillota bacterium]
MQLLFTIIGIVSGIHLYTYGRWLKQQGNIAGFILAILVAAAAVILPGFRFIMK